MMCQSSMTMRHNKQPAGCLSESLRIAQNWEEASKTLDYSSYASSGIHFLSKEAGNVRLTKGDADVILSSSHEQRLTQILALYGWGQWMLPSSLCVSLLRQPRLFNFYRTSNSRDNLAVVQQSDDNGKKNQRKQKFKKPRFEIEMLTSVYQSSPLLSPSSKMQQSKKLIIQSPI